MAQSYDQTASNIINTITSTDAGISAATAGAILALLPENQEESVVVSNYTPGAELAPDTVILNVAEGTNLDADPGVGEAIIMAQGTSANVTFGAESAMKAMVVGDGGGSNVVFDNNNDVAVTLTGGENDSVSTGGGNDNIEFTGGSATIDTGAGNDTVSLTGGGVANILGGIGNMVVWLQAHSPVAATIDGGDGFDRVSLASHRDSHHFSIVNGKIQMHSEQPVTMENMNLIVFDTNSDGAITKADQVTVIAENQIDSLVAKLYKVALGREPIDGADGWDGNDVRELGGITWWTTEYEKRFDNDTQPTLEQVAKDFLGAKVEGGGTEFGNLYNGMDNAQFVQALFNNLNEGVDNPVANIGGHTAEEWAQQLNAGMITREDVAFNLANSAEAVQILGIDGQQYVIEPIA